MRRLPGSGGEQGMNEQEHIDRRKALQWLDGDERMLVKIKEIFMKNIPSQVEALKAYLDADDIESTERQAHMIMGSSAMIGASVMSDEAWRIEQSAIAGDMDAARAHFTRFAEEYGKVITALAGDGGAW